MYVFGYPNTFFWELTSNRSWTMWYYLELSTTLFLSLNQRKIPWARLVFNYLLYRYLFHGTCWCFAHFCSDLISFFVFAFSPSEFISEKDNIVQVCQNPFSLTDLVFSISIQTHSHQLSLLCYSCYFVWWFLKELFIFIVQSEPRCCYYISFRLYEFPPLAVFPSII